MAATENLYDQFGSVKRSFDTTTHTFFNLLAAAISNKFRGAGIQLQLTGRTNSGNKVTATLLGQVVCKDQAEQEKLHDTIESEFNALKNPAALLDLLK